MRVRVASVQINIYIIWLWLQAYYVYIKYVFVDFLKTNTKSFKVWNYTGTLKRKRNFVGLFTAVYIHAYTITSDCSHMYEYCTSIRSKS